MRFHSLDSWRGICAILVALMHLPVLGHLYDLPFLRNSYLFVDFFFVLSGFVITHSYGGRILDWGSAAEFMVRRIGRIWPLHLFVLFLFVALETMKLMLSGWYGDASHAPFTGETSLPSLVTNILLIHATGIHDIGMSWNGPSWSISAEFVVYAIFAVGLLAFRSRIAVVLGVLATAGAFAVFTFSPTYMDTQQEFGVLRCLFGFTVGHLVCRLRRSGDEAAGTGSRFGSLAEAASLVAVVLFVSLVGVGPASMAAPLLFGAVIHVFASGCGIFTRLLNTRPMRRLGELSFSIYMIHGFGIELMMKGANIIEKMTGWRLKSSLARDGGEAEVLVFGEAWMMDIFTLAYVIAVVLVAELTYRLVEKPGQRFFNDLPTFRIPAAKELRSAVP
ncbi:acyltransferase family protein [Skermanella pratensis]|uniref:acyltransferase family protein n=1 Tax=Skermanella pratensis TaxID=2233999 RepID=UPI0013017DD1|nr:acyltransferase [Skermanella pratensis]